eukprot:CAMPEP_0175905338 /NCGR_PEP_ID=MMETSP0108-20121206/4956_1 /TAXON_ID=195067 ORGANISM="Goniomonas pacifica, Strain CCMP1869" /NCGR_SAMPLE_ID=MMETSP0108 /ASSEMBLY_ACC=CAM_ASM_000204 /LENGTH=148 /DNA_ID=CAMNT_0017227209 /DNA_START=153 /DNA_END=599 /DNA_ORIENTATION=+
MTIKSMEEAIEAFERVPECKRTAGRIRFALVTFRAKIHRSGLSDPAEVQWLVQELQRTLEVLKQVLEPDDMVTTKCARLLSIFTSAQRRTSDESLSQSESELFATPRFASEDDMSSHCSPAFLTADDVSSDEEQDNKLETSFTQKRLP